LRPANIQKPASSIFYTLAPFLIQKPDLKFEISAFKDARFPMPDSRKVSWTVVY
jgi:hypothetical protein